MLSQWLLHLSEFDFENIHGAVIMNEAAVALSELGTVGKEWSLINDWFLLVVMIKSGF